MTSTASALTQSAANNRAAVNRENAQHSTGPRTEAGKQRSALNALTHGLTSRTALLPAEDLAAYQNHCQQLRDLKDAAAILELHKHKGIPWEPADNGFVFSKDEVERASQRMMRLNESRRVEYCRFGSFANAKNAF
jgi:hypothetical protein